MTRKNIVDNLKQRQETSTKLSQLMQPHPHIGSLITSLSQDVNRLVATFAFLTLCSEIAGSKLNFFVFTYPIAP